MRDKIIIVKEYKNEVGSFRYLRAAFSAGGVWEKEKGLRQGAVWYAGNTWNFPQDGKRIPGFVSEKRKKYQITYYEHTESLVGIK